MQQIDPLSAESRFKDQVLTVKLFWELSSSIHFISHYDIFDSFVCLHLMLIFDVEKGPKAMLLFFLDDCVQLLRIIYHFLQSTEEECRITCTRTTWRSHDARTRALASSSSLLWPRLGQQSVRAEDWYLGLSQNQFILFISIDWEMLLWMYRPDYRGKPSWTMWQAAHWGSHLGRQWSEHSAFASRGHCLHDQGLWLFGHFAYWTSTR